MATTQEPKTRKGLRPIPLGWATFWLAVAALAMVAVLGRYQVLQDGYKGAVWRLDRWTGEMIYCGFGSQGYRTCTSFLRVTHWASVHYWDTDIR